MPTLISYILLFTLVGVLFIFVHLVAGKLVRPNKPEPEKMTVYECGEPTVGSAWVQFDLRYYVVALLFVIFEVEVAFFFPWGVVFGKLNALSDPSLAEPALLAQRQELINDLLPPYASAGTAPAGKEAEFAREQATAAGRLAWIALCDILVFFGVLLVGFAYLWKRGDLDWVRSIAAERAARAELAPQPPPDVMRPPLIGSGQGL